MIEKDRTQPIALLSQNSIYIIIEEQEPPNKEANWESNTTINLEDDSIISNQNLVKSSYDDPLECFTNILPP